MPELLREAVVGECDFRLLQVCVCLLFRDADGKPFTAVALLGDVAVPWA